MVSLLMCANAKIVGERWMRDCGCICQKSNVQYGWFRVTGGKPKQLAERNMLSSGFI